MTRASRPAPAPVMVETYPCGECGWRVSGREYHPYIACIVYKATRRNPLPYLHDVVRFYQDHPDELPASLQEAGTP